MIDTEARPQPRAVTAAGQRTVVVGYDEQPAGIAALIWAADSAARRGARLRGVHQLSGREVPDRYGPAEGSAELVRRGRSRVANTVTEQVGVVDHLDVFVTTEPIADELVRESIDAELLVVGSSYAHLPSAVLFDAPSRFIAQHSHCPVLLVPAGATPSSVAGLVCGVDRSAGASEALRWAAHDAALRGVTVLAAQVQPPVDLHGFGSQEPLGDWVAAQDIAEPTTIVCHVISRYSPASELVNLAAERQSMLVVGAPGRHTRRGHVASHVTSQDRVPVVIVPMKPPTPRVEPELA